MSRKNKTKSSLLAACCMPVLICLLCGGIALLALIRPYEKMSTYLHIAFMDSMKTGTGSGTDGLQIKETEIDTNYSGSTSGEGSVVIPSFGEQYAILSCEAIDLYVPVYWGGGSELLELGACQSSGSAAIGSKGNSVISAHVNTFFQNLNQLQKGDTLTLYTSYGRFTYTVSELISIADTDEQYLKQTQDDRLTLYTCEMQVLGASKQRVGAICTLTEKAFYQTAQTEQTGGESTP